VNWLFDLVLFISRISFISKYYEYDKYIRARDASPRPNVMRYENKAL